MKLAIFTPYFLSFSRALEPGGGKRIRTADHLVANQALSQLSYTPVKLRIPDIGLRILNSAFRIRQSAIRLVGLGRFELPTSRLSGVRSSHLSYRPLL